MVAAREGRSDIVKILLEKGADINGANDEGDNPLMFAAMNDIFRRFAFCWKRVPKAAVLIATAKALLCLLPPTGTGKWKRS